VGKDLVYDVCNMPKDLHPICLISQDALFHTIFSFHINFAWHCDIRYSTVNVTHAGRIYCLMSVLNMQVKQYVGTHRAAWLQPR
jgi:hypothetical protein